MFGVLDIPTSALVAQRQRMVTISANMTMMNTPVDPRAIADGSATENDFRRRIPIFAPGDPAHGSSFGVHLKNIMFDEAPFRKVYDKDHPLAFHIDDSGKEVRDGYVRYPNINPATEQMNMLEASRAYEANITVAEATKSMLNAAIRLLA